MANMAMILGDTGDGKTFSIRSLDPSETFLMSPFKQRLSWKGSSKDYSIMIPGKTQGNMLIADSFDVVSAALDKINAGQKFNNVVLDDFQFLQGFRAIRTAHEVGFTKFTVTAEKYISLFDKVSKMRDNLTVFFLCHTEISDGVRRARIGSKFVEEVSGCLESFFDVVLGAGIDESLSKGDELYGYFQTEKVGGDTLKSPYEMFESSRIPNSLQIVGDAMREYYN